LPRYGDGRVPAQPKRKKREVMSHERLVAEKKLMELLDSVHDPDLDAADCQILAALDFGYSRNEISTGCDMSDRTVDRRIEKMMSRIFTRMGIEGNERLLLHWARRHVEHCTWHAHNMAENGQIFALK
jgi:hypothetical protein